MKKIVSLIIIFFLLVSIFCSCLVFSKDTNLKSRPNLIFNKSLQKLKNIEKNMVLYQNNISFDLKIREENGEWKDENLTAYIGSIIEFKIEIQTIRAYPYSLTAALTLPNTDDGQMFDYIENSEYSSKKTTFFDATDEAVAFIWLPVLKSISITCSFKARIKEIASGNISGVGMGVIDEDHFDFKNDSINITSIMLPNPEKPDKPQGPTSGFIFENYTYSSSTTDPNGDQVYYKWDWDNEISDWDGPYDSGYKITAIHSWSANGTYHVRVKAKDTYENESPWSDPLVVSIPKNKAINIPLFLQRILHRFNILNIILNQIL
jgi:uncharacterized protein YxeA